MLQCLPLTEPCIDATLSLEITVSTQIPLFQSTFLFNLYHVSETDPPALIPKESCITVTLLNTQIEMTFTNYLSTYSPNTYACSWVLLLRVHRKKGSHVTWSCNSQDSCRNKQYRHNVHPNQYKSFQKIESSPFLLSTAQSCRNKSYTKKP